MYKIKFLNDKTNVERNIVGTTKNNSTNKLSKFACALYKFTNLFINLLLKKTKMFNKLIVTILTDLHRLLFRFSYNFHS